MKDGPHQPDQAAGQGAEAGKLIANGDLAESTRDQIPADQHEPSPSLAQKSKKNPPEDPIIPETCKYHLSEDGTECVTIKEPCVVEASEVPPLKGCPKREITSSRTVEAPISPPE